MLPEVVRQAKINRLTQKYQTKNQQWDRISDIIGRLKNNLAVMPEGKAKIHLEDEIKEEEVKFQTLENDMKQIEKELSDLCQTDNDDGDQSPLKLPQEDIQFQKSGLDNFLLYLDFSNQIAIFQEFIDTSDFKGGAFLIHGSMNYGHLWLLKRLLEEIPHHRAIPPIEYDARNPVYVSDVGKLWRTLAKKVNLPSRASHENIAQRLSARLQKQDVIFIFHGMEYMGEAYFQEIIQDFWQPLVALIQATQTLNGHFQLLMFLIDYKDEVSHWNIRFAERIDAGWQPQVPVKLPKIRSLSETILSQLQLPFAASVLPRNVFERSDLIQSLLKSTNNGIPGLVLKEIYELCDYDWYEEEEKWLKL